MSKSKCLKYLYGYMSNFPEDMDMLKEYSKIGDAILSGNNDLAETLILNMKDINWTLYDIFLED